MVQVKMFDGVLEGEKIENEYGGTIYSFKGIPYAEPPIGDLRFKAPVQIQPWDGIREAKQFGSCCPQYNSLMHIYFPGNEDCLYLNVYSPNLVPTKPLPVMFWIHGGAFAYGSSDFYRPEYLVRHDVILVTINYRLEVLGFLSLNSEEIPGNAGMKDQVEAMRWVQRNIASFGGDPNNITIFGVSAGAVCVSFHLISPMTKGLFKRAIVQSGSCINCWSQNSMPRERARVLLRHLGFESDNDKEIYEFLKAQPVESLININAPLTYYEAHKVRTDIIYFNIVNEMDFENNERYFYGDIFEALRAGIHEGVEVINGYTEHEGTVMLLNKETNEKIFKEANSFPEFFVPTSVLWKSTIAQQLQIGRDIKNFYFGSEKVSLNNIIQLIRFYTTMFDFGIILWQNICAKIPKNKMYLYKFTCKSSRNVMKTKDALGPNNFTSHADDVAYIFPLKGDRKNIMNSEEFKMVNNVTKLWTNFAKYGNPTPDDTLSEKWLPFTLDKKNYLNIGEHLVLEEDPEKEDFKFRTGIFKQFFLIDE